MIQFVHIHEIFADTIWFDDSTTVIGKCIDKGEEGTVIKFQAFGDTIEIPKKLIKRSAYYDPSKFSQPPMDPNSIQGDRATMLCIAASYCITQNQFKKAKGLYVQAYAANPKNFDAQLGYLRFHITELMKKVDKKQKNIKSLFNKFSKGGGFLIIEYAIWTHLTVMSKLSNDLSRKKIVAEIIKKLKSLRKKALGKMKKNKKKKFQDAIDKLVKQIEMLYFHPEKFEGLENLKSLGTIAKNIRILRKIAELFKNSEKVEKGVKPIKAMIPKIFYAEKAARNPKFKNVKHNLKIADDNSKNSGLSDREKKLLVALNDYREMLGLTRLIVDFKLIEAARIHSIDMQRGNFLSHKGKDNSTFVSRAKKAGFTGKILGENIQRSSKADSEISKVMLNWQHSPGHNINMLNPRFTHVGIGNEKEYWTQLFGTPQPEKK